MLSTQRLHAAARAGLIHLGASLAVAVLCAVIVFVLWFPFPYDEIVGGKGLFVLLVSVDVTCGPLLTLVVFDPRKPRAELWRDIGVIVLLQIAALAYGLHSASLARPVYLAYEKDIFRVVRRVDVDDRYLARAPAGLPQPGWLGPRLIGVRVAKPGDADYLHLLDWELSGSHLAYRPDLWRDYDSQGKDVLAHAKPLSLLAKKHPHQRALIDAAVARSGLPEAQLGFLPLSTDGPLDWVVLVSLADAQPKDFVHLDGW